MCTLVFVAQRCRNKRLQRLGGGVGERHGSRLSERVSCRFSAPPPGASQLRDTDAVGCSQFPWFPVAPLAFPVDTTLPHGAVSSGRRLLRTRDRRAHLGHQPLRLQTPAQRCAGHASDRLTGTPRLRLPPRRTWARLKRSSELPRAPALPRQRPRTGTPRSRPPGTIILAPITRSGEVA